MTLKQMVLLRKPTRHENENIVLAALEYGRDVSKHPAEFVTWVECDANDDDRRFYVSGHYTFNLQEALNDFYDRT